ncbi:MAG: carbamoyltransferase [Desulfuromonadales bacterium]|nr:carbamoyltransferase [Desulfuromonadales bacterium]
MKILGVSALYHDSAAALCVDGEIIAAAQEERFTRKKNDLSIPTHSIGYCLAEGNMTNADLDAVVYYDNPLLTLDRWLKNCCALGTDSATLIEKSFDTMFANKLWIHMLIENAVGGLGKHGKLMACEHHVSHAASAFYPSPYSSAAIITMDGVGEWATSTIGRGHDSSIEIIKQINYPHSLGLLYSAFTYFCGFKINSGEYKLMGLAPYGEPKYTQKIKDILIDIKEDGSYRLNLDYFRFQRDTVTVDDTFCGLFDGPRRQMESTITKREMDLAASIQKVTEEIMVKMAIYARKLTNEKNLCLSGGVALNCVANGAIHSKGIFDNIWIQPASGDAGGALGAALYTDYSCFKTKRTVGVRDAQKGSYLGPSFSKEKIRDFLDSHKANYSVVASNAELTSRVAEMLSKDKIIGFFSGRMEFGPRALGARSILGNPMSPEMQQKLNLKIKFRESFRPFAPIVMSERVGNYFEFTGESPYMLLTAPVKPELRKEFVLSKYISDKNDNADMLPAVNQIRSTIPAVTHVDYSARLQTVNKLDHPLLHQVLADFERITGCAVLVNTSFNVRGEPIVCTPEDAFLCFMRTDMDVLVLENCVLLKEDQSALANDVNWREQYELD